MAKNGADKQGRAYAVLDQVRPGQMVQIDGDFTCMKPWSMKRVQKDADGRLYLACDEGKHFLDGQLERDGWLMGVYPHRVVSVEAVQ